MTDMKTMSGGLSIDVHETKGREDIDVAHKDQAAQL